MAEEHTGIYVCSTKGCTQRDKEVEHPWCQDWPLAKRQKKCRVCKKRMLFFRVKKVMTDAAKAKLAALNERRAKEREES